MRYSKGADFKAIKKQKEEIFLNMHTFSLNGMPNNPKKLLVFYHIQLWIT